MNIIKVTVGIPHYKSITSLKRLLEGLSLQKENPLKLKEVRIIVVNDDGETTLNERDFIFPNLRITILNQENKGVAVARNRIIQIAEGKYIFFLDVDCVPTPGWLQSMYASFSDAEGMVAAVGGAIKPLPNHSGIINDYFNANNHLEKPLTDRKTGIVRAVVTANCGFRLAIIRSIHGFDEKTFKNLPPGGEDIDLSYRLRNHGYTLKYGENAIALHEYPNNFMDIVKKFSNYGRGIRVLCKAQKLDPKKIAQPRFNLFSIIKYGILVYKKVAIAYNKFKQHYGLSRVIPYTFFEIVRYYSFGYGYFFKGRTKDLIKT